MAGTETLFLTKALQFVHHASMRTSALFAGQSIIFDEIFRCSGGYWRLQR